MPDELTGENVDNGQLHRPTDILPPGERGALGVWCLAGEVLEFWNGSAEGDLDDVGLYKLSDGKWVLGKDRVQAGTVLASG